MAATCVDDAGATSGTKRKNDDVVVELKSKKRVVQSTLHMYRGTSGPCVTNPASDYGVRIYTEKEIQEAKGLESHFRKFWNIQASELCASTSVFLKLGSKTAIQGAIHTAWCLHKVDLLDLEVTELSNQMKDVIPDRIVLIKKFPLFTKTEIEC